MAFKCVLLLVFFVTVTHGNDSRWFDCAQTFCKTLKESAPSLYTVNLASVKIDDLGKLVGSLTSTGPNVPLTLTISLLENEVFRIFIDLTTQTTPPRFKAHAALVDNGENFTISKLTLDPIIDNTITATFNNLKVKIYGNPLKFEFYSGDRLISAINENNRFIYSTTLPNQSMRLDISFKNAHRAYGIPEHADHLSLRNTANGEPYRHFNLDYGNYELESPQALYGTIGVLYAHGNDFSSGAFWLNGAQTWIDVNNGPNQVDASFMSESGALDLFILSGPTLPSAVQQYTKLTGVAPLPQFFTLGYHQSRYSYMTQDEVVSVVNEFDKSSLPLDVMWLDIDYTDEKQYFTWDPVRFPNPAKLISDLTAAKRKLVAIIDPHIKVKVGYFLHDEATTKKYYVRDSSNTVDFKGNCWPGLSSYLDFLNPEAREYYSSLYNTSEYHFTHKNVHVWNDMNEPAVFDAPSDENSMPLNAKHYGGYEHRDVHNMYGFYQTVGTRKGMLDRVEKVRPFILTRSHFAGTQRYAAIWTGDNYATWDYLRISFPMCLTEALAGISFCGADVGGFGGIPDDELYQRWYQAGAWLPFYRGHSATDVPRREPYLYPLEIQKRVRNALRQRYAHIPLWYTLFYEHEQTGQPVIRPITYHYPKESDAFDIEYQVLIGPNVLAAPVLHKGVLQTTVYLPGGKDEIWYNIDENYKPYKGIGLQLLQVTLDSVPIFYKAGSIIPRKDIAKKSSTDMHQDPYTLYIALNGSGHAKGNLYIDDGETFDYETSKFYVNFIFDDNVLKFVKLNESNYAQAASIGNLVIINPPVNVSGAEIHGSNAVKSLNQTYTENVLLVSNFEAKLQDGFEIRLVFTSSASMLVISSLALFTVFVSVAFNL